ncbi:hypothetical protein BAUCODRAFT_426426 [Baudoinia panamericana UAMH 10762]|uniref:Uncharacterized protein n=1 Tax=Baudoinia panamericana (strain UAMH 10762) TaxID=717646 RepID=M2NGL9_BAUPA|nr:uncharacterized protein BAUCODRAFT_426426 [Baudoinia panamericana UAMH 10762]EMC98454.1 hypothetical protein BAUCODRAFT_426426 [Baudoinia panamericana UAMH 10762]
MSSSSIALPGHNLGPIASNNVGPGTHIHCSHLFASIAGSVITTPPPPKSKAAPTVSIAQPPLLPEVGTLVLGRITRTNPRQANLSILALYPSASAATTDPVPLAEPFSAIIRQQDIRLTEIDKVKVAESFRVGDIVRAVVISLGDERSYYASTAKNELGVVMAWSEASGEAMWPVSWREFEDPSTGVREARKVAKPV